MVVAGPAMSLGAESILTYAIERSIKHHPDQAAREMLTLMRDNARLEAELFFLRKKLLALAYELKLK